MTLLTICQDIAEESKVKVPSTIIGNTELEAVRLLGAMVDTADDLLRRVDWQELHAEASISTVASTASYNLPSDFQRIVNDTAWNATTRYPMIGVTSAKDWQALQNATESEGSVQDYYRIRGDQLLIYPTPTAVESLVYEYIQNTPIESSGGAAQTTWLADTDIPKIDEYLVKLGARWRFKKMLGKAYADDKNQYEEIGRELISNNKGRKTIRPNYRSLRNVNIAYPHIVVAP